MGNQRLGGDGLPTDRHAANFRRTYFWESDQDVGRRRSRDDRIRCGRLRTHSTSHRREEGNKDLPATLAEPATARDGGHLSSSRGSRTSVEAIRQRCGLFGFDACSHARFASDAPMGARSDWKQPNCCMSELGAVRLTVVGGVDARHPASVRDGHASDFKAQQATARSTRHVDCLGPRRSPPWPIVPTLRIADQGSLKRNTYRALCPCGLTSSGVRKVGIRHGLPPPLAVATAKY